MKLPIAILQADPRNPRKISEQALAGLGVSVETFGDLSGITWNERSGHIVSGHQRMKSLQAAGATDWERDDRDPTRGYIVHPKTGERFAVRIVDWDETYERMANITANNPHIQGEFDDAALLEQLTEIQESPDVGDLAVGLMLDDLGAALELEDEAHAELKAASALQEFDVTPPPRPTWMLIAATEDVAAEIEALLQGRFGKDRRIRIERSNAT